MTRPRLEPQLLETELNRQIGCFHPATTPRPFDQGIAEALQADEPVYVVRLQDGLGVATDGQANLGDSAQGMPLIAYAPAIDARQLGDAGFRADHGLDYAYMSGAMANGIASAELVAAMGQIRCLGSYGAAGQRLDVIEAAIDQLQRDLPDDAPRCFNLIHSPNEPAHEMGVVELYLRRKVRLVEASAYLGLTLPAVRYRVSGIYRDEAGRIVTPNRIIAKASRIEVATRWLSPPPAKFLDELVKRGDISSEQAELARQIPMAQDLIAEADSGGHTDNRPAITMLPTFLALRDRMTAEHAYSAEHLPLRVGLAGGIATPSAVSAAFAMGAGFVVTGSINQACIESGSSDVVRQMLAEAEQADITMAPAADMFEMGVKLQVLKRGTMFAMRAQKLYDLYRAYLSLDAIPAAERSNLEKTVFRASFEEIWDRTRQYFSQYDPDQVRKAENDPKHKMALVFRWYLGLSSRWANAGEMDRRIDYQVWCGPAMGAFNEWTRGTNLALAANRRAADVAMALMQGARIMIRINALRNSGVPVPTTAYP